MIRVTGIYRITDFMNETRELDLTQNLVLDWP